MTSIYLDHNATTPVDSHVLNAMMPFFQECYANPSGAYHLSRLPYRVVRDARRSLAGLLEGAVESEILFTSGGTESINTAIRSAIKTQNPRNEIIISTVEHASVKKLALELKEEGFRVHQVNVDRSGQIKKDELIECLSEKTAVVSLMLANNETGVVFPIEDLGMRIKQSGALFHVDAVQAAGKIPVSVKNGHIDFLSLSAHKFYGPKGVGALYVREGTPFHSLIVGGSQEKGKRAGTENVAGISGLGQAAKMAKDRLEEDAQWFRYLRDEFEERVVREIPEVRIHSQKEPRLPNTSNLRFQGVDAESLLASLDQAGICVSRGSACMSGAHEPSHVLKAMGMSEAEAKAAIRISFGRGNCKEDLDRLIEALTEEVTRLRNLEAVSFYDGKSES